MAFPLLTTFPDALTADLTLNIAVTSMQSELMLVNYTANTIVIRSVIDFDDEGRSATKTNMGYETLPWIWRPNLPMPVLGIVPVPTLTPLTRRLLQVDVYAPGEASPKKFTIEPILELTTNQYQKPPVWVSSREDN